MLTATVGAGADRIAWDLDGDGNAEIVGGADQTSIRFRPLPGQATTVRAWAIGASGEGPALTHQLGAIQRLEGKTAELVQKTLATQMPVYAVGAANVLSQPPPAAPGCSTSAAVRQPRAFAALTRVVSGSSAFTGAFAPITKIAELPKPELGVISNVGKAFNIPAKPEPIATMIGLSDAYIASDRVVLNKEFVLTPRCNSRVDTMASIVGFPQIHKVGSSGGGFRFGGGEFDFPIGRVPSNFAVTINPRDDIQTIVTGNLAKFIRGPATTALLDAVKALGGKLVGDVNIDMVADGAVVTVNLKLPGFLSFGGGDAQARVKMGMANGRLAIDELTIGPINVGMGGLGVSDLKIDYRRAEAAWDGSGKACVVSVACLDGFLKIRRGAFDFFRGDLDLRPLGGVPLGPGVLLEGINFGTGLNPTRFTGGANVSFSHVLLIKGQMVFAFPSPGAPFILDPQEVPGFPGHLYGQQFTRTTIGLAANASLRVAIAEIPLANAYVLYEVGAYLALGGRVQYAFRDPLTGIAWVSVNGGVDGEFNTINGKFNVDGGVEGCVAGVICKKFGGNVSSNGMSVCTAIDTFLHEFHVGGAIRWSPVKFIPYLDGCKWGRFRVPDVRGAAAAAEGDPYTVDIQRGDPSRMIMLDGETDAPRVTVTGPGGQLLESPEGSELVATTDTTIRILRSEESRFTSVAFAGAKPGTYLIDPTDDSPAIAELQESKAMPAARVSGKVSGSGAKRVLRFDVEKRPDQAVSFFEIDGQGAGREIGSIKGGGKGKFKFIPAPGAGARRVEARFSLDGVPAETKKIASFKPLPAKLAKPKGLRVARRGNDLRAGWKRVKGATSYEVTVAPSAGAQTLVKTRKPTVVLKKVARAWTAMSPCGRSASSGRARRPASASGARLPATRRSSGCRSAS